MGEERERLGARSSCKALSRKGKSCLRTSREVGEETVVVGIRETQATALLLLPPVLPPAG